jgi:hypothetical protein
MAVGKGCCIQQNADRVRRLVGGRNIRTTVGVEGTDRHCPVAVADPDEKGCWNPGSVVMGSVFDSGNAASTPTVPLPRFATMRSGVPSPAAGRRTHGLSRSRSVESRAAARESALLVRVRSCRRRERRLSRVAPRQGTERLLGQRLGVGLGLAGQRLRHRRLRSPGPIRDERWHTLRVQSREDGFSIDQIVLSSSTYLSASPGALKSDVTLLPECPAPTLR